MTDPNDTFEQGRRGESYNPADNGSLEQQYEYGLLAVGAVYLAEFVFTKPEWFDLLVPAGALGALLGTLVGERDAIAEIADAES
jgi:hypothetical protein